MEDKRKTRKWRRLDNSAKIFPIISNKRFSSVFRLSVVLKEEIKPDLLKQAVENTIARYDSFKVKLKKGFFWYYFEFNPKDIIIEEEKTYPCKYIDKN
ncbi:MAG: MFS transporter, partial [Clostridia bacterium]